MISVGIIEPPVHRVEAHVYPIEEKQEIVVLGPIKEEIEPETVTLEKLPVPIECSCIKTARALGVPIPYNTDARDIVPNTPPQVGALALFRYGEASHAAMITGLRERGFWVEEGNKTPCKRTQRFIPWDDPALTGFKSYEK